MSENYVDLHLINRHQESEIQILREAIKLWKQKDEVPSWVESKLKDADVHRHEVLRILGRESESPLLERIQKQRAIKK